MLMHSGIKFLEEASPRIVSLMQALGVAESLTNTVAREILMVRGISEQQANKFLELLHCADFVVPRNSEWYFSIELRRSLRESAVQEKVSLENVHQLLLKIGKTADRADAGDIIPAYLFTPAGTAYHLGELGFSEFALQHYGSAADDPDIGKLWLAALLSQEQQKVGILPADAVEPIFLMALSAYRENDYARAYPNLLIVANSDKRTEVVARAMQLAGLIEMSRGECEPALHHLTQAIDIFDTLNCWKRCVWALAARAEALRQLDRRSPEALDDLKRAISMCSGDWKALLLCKLAVIERELFQNENSRSALDMAENNADKVLDTVLIQRANLRSELGDFEGALSDLNRAETVSIGSRLSVTLNTRAYLFWNLGKWDDALRDLDRALKVAKYDNYATILNTRSCVKRDQGDFVGSLDDDKAIIKLSPRFRHKIRLDSVKERMKRVEITLLQLEKIHTENNSNEFWFQYFLSMTNLRKRVSAPYRIVELMKRALEYAHNDQDYAKCFQKIGCAYEKTVNDKSRAVEYLNEAIAINPHDSTSLATLGHVLNDLGHSLQDVAPYFLRAIEANKKNKWARSWYALALSKEGHHEEAIQFAKSAIGNTQNSIILFNLALVLDASPNPADRQEAIDYARQAATNAETRFDAPARFLEARVAP